MLSNLGPDSAIPLIGFAGTSGALILMFWGSISRILRARLAVLNSRWPLPGCGRSPAI